MTEPSGDKHGEGSTPRTDAAAVDLGKTSVPVKGEWVGAPFARQLERELDHANKSAFAHAQRAYEATSAVPSLATPTINYQRAPEYDRRIGNGDDFAGDAFIRWVAVGQEPHDAHSVAKALSPRVAPITEDDTAALRRVLAAFGCVTPEQAIMKIQGYEDEWPGGLEEIESSINQFRTRAEAAEARLSHTATSVAPDDRNAK